MVRGYLDKVERYLAQGKLLSPLFYKQLQPLGILVPRVAHIRTTLIEQDTLHRVVQYRVKGAVAPEKTAQIVLIGFEGYDTS